MSVNHLQKARELLARKKKKQGEEEGVLVPETNGHHLRGLSRLRKQDEIIRINSAPTTREKPKKIKGYTETDFLGANEELANTFNLIYRGEDVGRVIMWLQDLTDVSVDSETYGIARTEEERKKLRLSFVKGKIRLIQLSNGLETYFLDAMFLSREAIARVLEALKGTTLYLHNAIFDLPRFQRHFGVDLTNEDVRDTMMLSRLARAGEWVDDPTRKSRTRPLEHTLKAALAQEGVAGIPHETDHRWNEPLNAERLTYARDDVLYLIPLERALMGLIEKRELLEGLRLFKRVYPAYLRMQYRGVPLDLTRFEELTRRYRAKVEEASAQLEEHKPDHPEEDGGWVWATRTSPTKSMGTATGSGATGP